MTIILAWFYLLWVIMAWLIQGDRGEKNVVKRAIGSLGWPIYVATLTVKHSPHALRTLSNGWRDLFPSHARAIPQRVTIEMIKSEIEQEQQHDAGRWMI